MSSPISDPFDAPIDASRFAWPTSTLDPVSKMRALAAGLAHCAVRETVLDAPFERVWETISDLENATPRYEGLVSQVEILERHDETLRIRSRMRTGVWIESNVVLQPGWCLMRSRLGQIGMAANPVGTDRTRFIHFEGSQLFGRLLRPFFHWNIGGDFRRLSALLAESPG